MITRVDTRSAERIEFDTVLLDAAGTLITPSEPVAKTYAAVAGRFGVVIDPGALGRAFSEIFQAMPDLAFTSTSMDELQRLEREWWRTLVLRVITWTGNTVDEFDLFFETLYAHYSHGRAWQCYPEVTAVLDGLRARGCKLAVVSNFDSRLPGILEALGIHDYMDAVIYSSQAGSAKPDRAIFTQALDALGASPERTVHVGDSAKADYEGAVAAGLRGLLIRREHSPGDSAKHHIHRLDELLTHPD